MLKEININILGLNNLNINIDILNNKIKNNNKEIKFNYKIISKLINMIILWKYDYGRDNKFDSEEFIIELITDNENIIYKGKGNYPENYSDFKALLGELA